MAVMPSAGLSLSSALPALGLLGGLLGKGDQSSSTSSATNTNALSFNPTLGFSIGGGVGAAPSVYDPTEATSTTSDPTEQVQEPSSGTSPLTSLFPFTGTAPATLGTIPLGTGTTTTTGITGSLTSSDLLLLGGLALLLVMAMGHHKGGHK